MISIFERRKTMKRNRYTWIDGMKEVLKELLVVVLYFGICIVALIIGALLPIDFAELPFEVLMILAVAAILAILYMIAAIVTIIIKIKAKVKQQKNT